MFTSKFECFLTHSCELDLCVMQWHLSNFSKIKLTDPSVCIDKKNGKCSFDTASFPKANGLRDKLHLPNLLTHCSFNPFLPMMCFLNVTIGVRNHQSEVTERWKVKFSSGKGSFAVESKVSQF